MILLREKCTSSRSRNRHGLCFMKLFEIGVLLKLSKTAISPYFIISFIIITTVHPKCTPSHNPLRLEEHRIFMYVKLRNNNKKTKEQAENVCMGSPG